MRVSLGAPAGGGPRQIDAYTFGFGGRTYRGTYAVLRDAGGESVVVNTLPLDAYLYGVVSHEVSAGWPRAALQAQSVAARTYALLRRRPSEPYDVVASTSDQFYGGVETEEVEIRDAVDSTSGEFVLYDGRAAHVLYGSCCGGFTANADAVRLPAAPVEIALADLGRRDDVRSPNSDADDVFATQPPARATSGAAAPAAPTTDPPAPAAAPRERGEPIEPTAAEVDAEMAHPRSRTYVPPQLAPIAPPTPASAAAPAPAPAPDAASPLAGAGAFPYLVAHADPHCIEAPVYRWHRDLAFAPAAYFGADLARRLGDVRSIELRDVDRSGRPAFVRLIGSRAAFDVDSADFRRRFGGTVVRSTRFDRVAPGAGTISLDGRGFGHGVGLCQWGARGMASSGASAGDILAFYYPGTALGSI